MPDNKKSSNDTQDYGVQPPIIPDDSSFDEANPKDRASTSTTKKSSVTPPAIGSNHIAIINDIIGKIDEANNILIALSADPSVDELATAIALSLSLDKLEKRVTAIYSGETPDALSFLKPEDTFESQPDALQDFVIALNKDKADHLRYKIDGEYVKIFITPYRSRISQDDLEFSYGDFNVDLIIALDVANGVDLDDALREHGRIMHDATIVNITTANPGKLGEIEWSDTKASSVAEMVAELLLTIGKLEKPEATALLTGIIAATDRFANSHTTSHSLEIASQLVNSGANQQLIAKNIASELDSDNLAVSKTTPSKEETSIADNIRENSIAKEDKDDDPMSIDIRHHDDEPSDEPDEKSDDEPSDEPSDEPDIPTYKEVLGEADSEDPEILPNQNREFSEPEPEDDSTNKEDSSHEDTTPESSEGITTNEEDTASDDEDESLTEDLEDTEATLSNAGAEVVPEAEKKPFSLQVNTARKMVSRNVPDETSSSGSAPSSMPDSSTEQETKDTVAEPASETSTSQETSDQHDELEETKSDEENSDIVGPFGPDDEENEEDEEPSDLSQDKGFLNSKAEKVITPPSSNGVNTQSTNPFNPAVSSTPPVASSPEVNNLPNMNYMPMPGDEILPPPPTPPVDFNNEMPPISPGIPNVSPNNSIPNMAQPTPSVNSNPFLNPMPSQNPLLSNTPANSPTPSMGSSMPQMRSNNPFATPPSMPNSNPNPFMTQSPMPNQPGMPGQIGNNQSMNNPGAFQIPGM